MPSFTDEMLACAVELIEELGTTYTLKQNRPNAEVDAAKPWLGKTVSVSSNTVDAVVLPLDYVDRFNLRRTAESLQLTDAAQAFIAGSAPALAILPGDVLGSYTVKAVLNYAPQGTTILYHVLVNK